jgi:hypothetical protein
MVYKRDYLFEQVGMGSIPNAQAIRLNKQVADAVALASSSRSAFLARYDEFVKLADDARTLAMVLSLAPLAASAQVLKQKLRELKIPGSIPIVPFPKKPKKDDDEEPFGGPLEPLFPVY